MRTKISKQIASIAAMAAVIATTAFAQSEPVYSVNVIGMQKVDVGSGSLSLGANPFSSSFIEDVAGLGGKPSSFANSADNVLVFNPVTQSYTTYHLASNATLGLHWRLGGVPQTNLVLDPSVGFFYKSRSTASWTNTRVGDVVMDKAVTNIIRSGLNLLSYPYSVNINLTNLNLKAGKTSSFDNSADNLMVFDDQTQSYTTYHLSSNATLGAHWRLGGTPVTNLILQAGKGFWYRSRLTNDVSWVEQTPYPDL